PGYAVMYTDGNGVLQTIPGKLWHPDTATMMEQNRRLDAEEQAQREQNARRMQDIERQQMQRRDMLEQEQRATGARLRGETPPQAQAPRSMPAEPPSPAQEIQEQGRDLRDQLSNSLSIGVP